MSASAPVTPAAPEAAVANKFTLHDAEDTTQVTYYPTAPGPLISGKTERGPLMEYAGEEGNFSFSGTQIGVANCPLGTLISVTLRPNADAGALLFTLVLPSVSEAPGSKMQSFKTIGIKTHTRGFIVAAGADRTYDVLQLCGAAETVLLPM